MREITRENVRPYMLIGTFAVLAAVATVENQKEKSYAEGSQIVTQELITELNSGQREPVRMLSQDGQTCYVKSGKPPQCIR